MHLIAGQPYINLDTHLPLEHLPNIEDAIVDSYPLIKQNTWQKTINLQKELTNCNWPYKNRAAKSSQNYFEIEVRNQSVAPMWILDLTDDGNQNPLNLYDSLTTPKHFWDNIKIRKDLPASWNPFLNWLQEINCFEKLGRTSLLLTRPGLPIHYHRDIGVSDEEYTPYAHRQEFLWINMTPQKTLYILDEKMHPTLFKCRSAFFNHHNWHGSHEPLPYWSFSFKIEGIFKESFRNKAGFSSHEKYS